MFFWGDKKLFTRNEKAVRLALRHPLLAGRQVMARGAYSIVLGGRHAVFKLTADRISYELAECQQQWRCRSLPEIKGLHGEVGTTDSGIPLFLLEIEPLKKLGVGTDQRKTSLSIGRRIRRNKDFCKSSADQLRDASQQLPVGNVRKALEHIAAFVDANPARAALDMHGSNFMQRPLTGEIVISDPLLDVGVRQMAQEHFAIKQGFSKTTTFL